MVTPTPAKDAGSNGLITVVAEVGPSLLAQPRIAPRNMIELTFYIRQTENRTTPRSLTKTKAKSFNVDLSLSHVSRIPEPKCRTCHPPFQHYCVCERSRAIAERLDPSVLVEEGTATYYDPTRFYPIQTGQILNNERYQIATKLGYGADSTVWLASDLHR